MKAISINVRDNHYEPKPSVVFIIFAIVIALGLLSIHDRFTPRFQKLDVRTAEEVLGNRPSLLCKVPKWKPNKRYEIEALLTSEKEAKKFSAENTVLILRGETSTVYRFTPVEES